MQHQFETKQIRYESADTEDKIYRQIRERSETYFDENKISKFADANFTIKIIISIVVAILAYAMMLSTSSFGILTLSFIVFGFAAILISINLGHDAAHGAVTGNKQIDDIIFRLVFSLQGLSGYLWQIRHNHSHHVLPNIYEHDSDMELGGLILLDRSEGMKWYHKYQYIYAPILYFFATIVLFLYQDYEMLDRREHGNLLINKIPLLEWVKFLLAKVIHITLYLGIPFFFSSQSWIAILLAYIVMHFTVSIFMMFTFVISHHVMEVDYIAPKLGNTLIGDAWIRHQIVTTIDFNENSRLANFIFGGFNLHVAHHVFPEINHTHYPALTAIIKDVLAENNLDWYKSFSFFDGCRSHIKHLKRVVAHIPTPVFEDMEDQEIGWI